MSYGSKLSPKQDKTLKIKEVFAILTQGVEMIHYDTDRSNNRASKSTKVVWMDTEALRFCVDNRRPTLSEVQSGKVPPGVYIRDIAEVRVGLDSFDFRSSRDPPVDSDNCFTLIATERTISLELPSKFACEWFYERLKLVAEDILTPDERAEKSRQLISLRSMTESVDNAAVDHLTGVLAKGIQVLHHHPTGRIFRSILSVDAAVTSLTLEPIERTFFGLVSVARPTTMKLSDVVEIRPGTHAFGFVGTNSTDKYTECLSIIGTQCTMDIQLSNQSARDIFSSKLRNLLLYVQLSVTSESI